MTLTTFLFWATAAVTALGAIAVVAAQNIVRAAIWLLFTLAGTSGLFFLLGSDFVAATQLLVYVGGTLVLVIFGVMLTAQGPFVSMKTGAAEWAISGIVGLLLLAVLIVSVLNFDSKASGPTAAIGTLGPVARKVNVLKEQDPATSPNTILIGAAFSGLLVGPRHSADATVVGLAGGGGRTSYLLPFEIVSVHLLVVLIGAAYLARAKRRRGTAS